jgi:CMP-N-acetylneuraminic acid synthetase
MKTLVIIPARAGSKGIKNKNLRKINNTSLVENTFRLASKLKNIDDIIVSTDSKKIIKISKKFKKIKSPFIRPKHLASDNSKMNDVVMHAINFLKKKKSYDYVVILQPTSPFRKLREVNKIINFTKKNKIKSLFSVTESWQHPSEFIEINNNGKMKNINSNVGSNRQNYKKVYFINGAVYMIKIDYFLKNKNLLQMNLFHS